MIVGKDPNCVRILSIRISMRTKNSKNLLHLADRLSLHL